MKAKIKETGEIKEFSASISTDEEILGYLDSNGIQYSINDIEIIHDQPWRYISSLSDKNIDWEQRRYELAKKASMTTYKNPIDKVTTDYLDIALRMVGISLDLKLIDKIIDLVELIEEKGGEASISDITKLKSHWLSTPTIEKFTGLKDRIGTRIFENDIIHYTEHNGYRLKSFNAVVVFDETYAAFGYQKMTENGNYEEQPIHYFTEHDELEIDLLPYVDVVGHVGEIEIL